MNCKFRVELKSLQNGEVYSIHEFTIRGAATTLQAAHMFDEALQDFLIDNARVVVDPPHIERIA